jgi:2-polyprenyl-3-methyl-5-hydroxy-6-metoxy-1,4-benzoquinol methylase
MVQVGTEAVPFSCYPELGDTERRAGEFGDFIRGKRWLDVGTGRGLILSLLKPIARLAVGVEPTAALRERGQSNGLTIFPSVDEVAGIFDCITLFSVFEHLLDPISMLKTLNALLAPGGKIILEVPHARDFLLAELDCIAFRAFTLWSEHLVLHTRESLHRLAQLAGLENCVVRSYQRYPVSNHLYWLRYGRPGGHEHWSFLNSESLHKEYSAALQAIDRTDTLVAVLTKDAGGGISS